MSRKNFVSVLTLLIMFLLISLRCFFAFIPFLFVKGSQVVKDYLERWIRMLLKCSQVNILKNKIVTNVEY